MGLCVQVWIEWLRILKNGVANEASLVKIEMGCGINLAAMK